MNPRVSARTVFVLLALPAVTGAREAFDLASFEPPPGWERSASPGQLTFRAPASDGQITLFASFATTAPPADNFGAEWARLVTTPLGVTTPTPTIEESPAGWTAVFGAANVSAQDQNVTILQVTTTGFGRALSIVAVLAGDQRLPEVTRFFDGVEFDAESLASLSGSGSPDAPVSESGPVAGQTVSATAVAIEPARVANGRPVGLFYRLRTGTSGGARLELETRTFLAGNRFTRMFPYEGGDSFDTARCIPDSCGTYELSADVLIVHWDDGRIDRWPFAATPEGVTLDGTLFRPAEAMSTASLAGEWSGAQAADNPYSNTYRFGPDGTFSFGSGGSMLHGRYAVEQLTLLLRFDDGDERRRTLFSASAQQPVSLICVEGDVYARQ